MRLAGGTHEVCCEGRGSDKYRVPRSRFFFLFFCVELPEASSSFQVRRPKTSGGVWKHLENSTPKALRRRRVPFRNVVRSRFSSQACWCLFARAARKAPLSHNIAQWPCHRMTPPEGVHWIYCAMEYTMALAASERCV